MIGVAASDYRNDQHVPTTIFEAGAMHLSIKVHCDRCTNAAIFYAAGLWWHFERRRRGDLFTKARKYFWCTRCVVGGHPRQRPSFLEAVRPNH